MLCGPSSLTWCQLRDEFWSFHCKQPAGRQPLPVHNYALCSLLCSLQLLVWVCGVQLQAGLLSDALLTVHVSRCHCTTSGLPWALCQQLLRS